ncbi:LysR family transcriptional regulator [Variovorax sp. PAMC 28711]|uniref:LysR family transcriptional regulator n=1 Tax=Variovorax sp. PAMC 28711 TaxID=1795631 RepID=UPI001F3FC36B|nr:LysR family transcriptional regulator [Variovorax sp. PAMC 28711]
MQSFARAAEQIHLSPSGMSMLVKELEEQVGARLFDRTTRTVTLTDAGKRMQPVAERILGEVHALGDAIEGSEAAIRQRLEIAATPMVSASLIPSVMHDFARSRPDVRIRLADVDVNQVRRRVLEGEADIGLGFFVKPAAGLVRRPLCNFRLMFLSPPGKGKARGGLQASRSWASIAGMPLVSLPADNPIQAVVEKQLAQFGQRQGERLRVNLIGTVLAMVRAGHGHAVVPSFVRDACLQLGLGVSMLSNPSTHIALYLVSQRGKRPTPAAQEFAAELIRAAERLTD